MKNLRVITHPSVEPITLERARLHLRLDTEGSPPEHPDDPLILPLISAARQYAEEFTGRAIAPIVYEWRAGAFASFFELPKAPAQDIVDITYVDADGVTQTVPESTYNLDPDPDAPIVELADGELWPAGTDVRITFTAGYSSEDSPAFDPLPPLIYAAMLLVLGHLYENREESTAQSLQSIPLGAKSLLRPFRLSLGMA